MEDVQYTEQIWTFLDKLKPGDKVSVGSIVKKVNHDKFIQAVKDYIETWPYGGGIEFSADYSHIKKIN